MRKEIGATHSSHTRLLGIAGSLRKGSYNKALLRAAQELVPEGVDLDIFDLEGIPPFNQDLENEPNRKVKDFKARVRAADGLLLATPEYNYSMPGVLKNAIDAACRPHGDNPFDGKAAAIMGASVGMLGTARAQYHLRQVCIFLNMHLLNRPEIMVPFAEEKFEKGGRLTDEKTRQKIGELIQELAAWVGRFKGVD